MPADVLSSGESWSGCIPISQCEGIFPADPEQPQTFHWGEDNYVIFIAKITLVIPQACFDFHQEESATML